MQVSLWLLVSLAAGISAQSRYSIPNVSLELLDKGFRVSIPDVPGIKNVAFNINRNRPFKQFEEGEFSSQVTEARNNLWSYENERALTDDDTLYVWLAVQHANLVYRRTIEPLAIRAIKTGKPDFNADTDESGGAKVGNAIASDDDSEPTQQSCQSSVTLVRNRHPCQGALIFEETFDGTALNLKQWSREVRLPLDNGDAEFVVYDNTVGEVHGGVLSIEPRLWNDDKPGTNIKQGLLDLGANCTASLDRDKECQRDPMGMILNVLPPVITGRVTTKSSFSFKYGRVEVKAKIPQGDWLLPLLLLEPLTNHYGLYDYASGQLRIAFARGNRNLLTENGTVIDGRRLYGGAVLTPEAESRASSMADMLQSSHFGSHFHVYALTWTDRELVLEVDGEVYGRLAGDFSRSYAEELVRSRGWKKGSYMAPFDQEFYIALGVSAGGHGDFPDRVVSSNHEKPWNNTSPKAVYRFWRRRDSWKPTWTSPALQVDYVRVYAL